MQRRPCIEIEWGGNRHEPRCLRKPFSHQRSDVAAAAVPDELDGAKLRMGGQELNKGYAHAVHDLRGETAVRPPGGSAGSDIRSSEVAGPAEVEDRRGILPHLLEHEGYVRCGVGRWPGRGGPGSSIVLDINMQRAVRITLLEVGHV